MMLTIFSCASWPSAYSLWKNVYLGLPSIFLSFTNIFSHSVGCLCVFSVVCFAMQNLLNLKASLVYFCFYFFNLRRWIQKKILLWFMSKNVLPMFSSRSFFFFFNFILFLNFT